jgi:TetR/AcrR family acrAB operon transcriptional repressor
MARCTKEEALETRNRILDAAEDVFHAQGVASTSLADVAEAAKVTRGAIYWHFRNKSDVLGAMCDRVQLPMEAMIAATADKHIDDPLGQLRKTWVFILKEAVHNPHSYKVFDILFHKCEFTDADEPVFIRQHKAFLQGKAHIAHVITNAVAKGQLPEDVDSHLAGITFHAMMAGLLSNWLFAPDSFDLAGDAEKLVDASLDNLRTAPSLRHRTAILKSVK